MPVVPWSAEFCDDEPNKRKDDLLWLTMGAKKGDELPIRAYEILCTIMGGLPLPDWL